MEHKLRQSQRDVLGVFRYKRRAFTDAELVEVCNLLANAGAIAHQSPSGIRTRRAELVELGLIRWTGEHRVVNGRRHRIWADVQQG